MRKRIPLLGAVPILMAIGATFYLVDNNAAEASVQSSIRGKVWTNEECLGCHTDAETLKRMQDKRGDPTYCQAVYNLLTKSETTTTKPATPAYSK